MARVLYVGDLHCPWEHPKALYHLQKIRDQFQCDQIVFLGDEIDAAQFSTKWAPNPDMPGPSDELYLAIKHLRPFYKAFPEATVLTSNHGMRIFKKFRVCGIPSKVVKRYEEILEFPETWTLVDSTEIDGVLAIHGEGFSKSSWRTAADKFKQSVVMGHIHSGAGIVYNQTKKKKFFSANFGCMINPRHMAFDYGKHLADKPVLGSGVVINGSEAYFVPLVWYFSK